MAQVSGVKRLAEHHQSTPQLPSVDQSNLGDLHRAKNGSIHCEETLPDLTPIEPATSKLAIFSDNPRSQHAANQRSFLTDDGGKQSAHSIDSRPKSPYLVGLKNEIESACRSLERHPVSQAPVGNP